LWKKIYFDGLNKYYSNALEDLRGDTASDLVLDSEGNLYVTGVKAKYNDTTYNMPFLMKVDKSTGNILWQKQWGGTEDNVAKPKIAIDSEGNIIVVSYLSFNSRSANYFAKFKQNGNLVVQKFLNGSDQYKYFAITTDNSGNLYYTGSENGMALAVIDRNLNLIFQKVTHSFMEPSTLYYVHSLSLDSSLNIYLVGEHQDTGVGYNPAAFIMKIPNPSFDNGSSIYFSYGSCSFTYPISFSWTDFVAWQFSWGGDMYDIPDKDEGTFTLYPYTIPEFY